MIPTKLQKNNVFWNAPVDSTTALDQQWIIDPRTFTTLHISPEITLHIPPLSFKKPTGELVIKPIQFSCKYSQGLKVIMNQRKRMGHTLGLLNTVFQIYLSARRGRNDLLFQQAIMLTIKENGAMFIPENSKLAYLNSDNENADFWTFECSKELEINKNNQQTLINCMLDQAGWWSLGAL